MRPSRTIAIATLAGLTFGGGWLARGGRQEWTVREAESHAVARLHQIRQTCRVAEAWAEANSDMPHGFEIIGTCLDAQRSSER